jgi:hypothetical protein
MFICFPILSFLRIFLNKAASLSSPSAKSLVESFIATVEMIARKSWLNFLYAPFNPASSDKSLEGKIEMNLSDEYWTRFYLHLPKFVKSIIAVALRDCIYDAEQDWPMTILQWAQRHDLCGKIYLNFIYCKSY